MQMLMCEQIPNQFHGIRKLETLLPNLCAQNVSLLVCMLMLVKVKRTNHSLISPSPAASSDSYPEAVSVL